MTSQPTGKLIGSVILGAMLLGLGFHQALTSFDGVIYVSHDRFSAQRRDPAAIRRDLDFSRLDGAELITASQRRLVTAARVILENGELGVELGHFVTRGPDRGRQLACDFYDRVEITFEAEGVAEGGDKPVMKVDGPCRTGADITRIEPIWIPIGKILNEKPADMELSYADHEDLSFRFDDMTDHWPKHWVMKSVRLYNEKEAGREVAISNQDLYQLVDRPLILHWNRQ